MNKKIIMLLAISLLFTLTLTITFATPQAVITNPSSYKLISGTETITWDANSSNDSRDMNAMLFYSWTPGAGHFPIVDINVFEVCDIETDLRWGDVNKHASGLELIETGNGFGKGSSIFEYGGSWNYISNFTGINPAYTWNITTNNWDANSDLNTNILAMCLL